MKNLILLFSFVLVVSSASQAAGKPIFSFCTCGYDYPNYPGNSRVALRLFVLDEEGEWTVNGRTIAKWRPGGMTQCISALTGTEKTKPVAACLMGSTRPPNPQGSIKRDSLPN